MKTQSLLLYGEIKKILPDNRFTVYSKQIERESLCYLSGKLKRGPKPAEGDEVKFEVDSTNYQLGRIVAVRNLR
jgi:translation initiation factor IF-1